MDQEKFSWIQSRIANELQDKDNSISIAHAVIWALLTGKTQIDESGFIIIPWEDLDRYRKEKKLRLTYSENLIIEVA